MTQPATLHVVTTDRRTRQILWDEVWCATCAAEHRVLFGADATVKITETPWTGEARACTSCDDSELAPEFRFNVVNR